MEEPDFDQEKDEEYTNLQSPAHEFSDLCFWPERARREIVHPQEENVARLPQTRDEKRKAFCSHPPSSEIYDNNSISTNNIDRDQHRASNRCFDDGNGDADLKKQDNSIYAALSVMLLALDLAFPQKPDDPKRAEDSPEEGENDPKENSNNANITPDRVKNIVKLKFDKALWTTDLPPALKKEDEIQKKDEILEESDDAEESPNHVEETVTNIEPLPSANLGVYRSNAATNSSGAVELFPPGEQERARSVVQIKKLTSEIPVKAPEQTKVTAIRNTIFGIERIPRPVRLKLFAPAPITTLPDTVPAQTPVTPLKNDQGPDGPELTDPETQGNGIRAKCPEHFDTLSSESPHADPLFMRDKQVSHRAPTQDDPAPLNFPDSHINENEHAIPDTIPEASPENPEMISTESSCADQSPLSFSTKKSSWIQYAFRRISARGSRNWRPVRSDHDNMWQDISVLETNTTYHIVVTGYFEKLVDYRLRQLQADFESMIPFIRSGNYNGNFPKRIEFYTYTRGRKGARRRKIYTIDSHQYKNHATETTEGVMVHQEVFTEHPQFVEVAQPPQRRREPRDVEHDGIISDLASDPPGQQSVYIPPGDPRKEAYRLSTFESFPKSTPTNIQELARHGFLYTGFFDRVKCYSCGRTVEKWSGQDRASDRRWHKQDCLLARGLGTDNVPIGGRFGPLLTNGHLGGSSSSASQPMDVGPNQTDQNYNRPVVRFPHDVPDLRGGTFQIQPGSSVVIGSSDPLPRQTPAPSRPPATSRPANPPSSAPPRGWRMANVISADHKRHLTNLYLNRELDRLASFGRWPTGRPNVSPVALARAAFFYLGDMDRTQCFSCGGVLRNWSYEDDAMDEHRTHFPNCRFVVGTERRNVPIPDRPETPQQLAERFPCRFPMNPHMRSEASRVDTFDRRWPINRTRAKPQEIAEAGFFFLGERDRVKCWYCNGGLQNWEYDDIPWVEHAKWFPNCQFMLQRQGQLFIYRYLSLSPHLPRPIIGRQDGSTIDPVVTPPVGQSARVQDIPPAEPRARVPTPPPTIVDPQEELRKRQERVDREMEGSEMVKFVLLMGYSANAIRRVLLEKLESGTPFDAQNIFEGTSPLLDAVMKMEEEIEKERQEEQATNIKFPSVSSNYSALSMGSMETAPSSGQASGVYQVSGFDQHDSDDEDIDLYGSLAEQPMNGVSVGASGGATNAPVSAGFIGTVTNGPMSIGSETRPHIWDVPEDPESMKEFIEQKKEERICKICFTENADMVFIPCSHMVCCKTCTEAIRQCPVCRTKIEKAIKTYVK